jgi:nucleoside diphosphate kinase
MKHRYFFFFFNIIKSCCSEMGKILEEIYSNGLTVARAQMVRLTASLAEELFQVGLKDRLLAILPKELA